ncbi:hypothetical protein EXIGLDRAFT_719338 [Exidia glandulosa HHB12029]|uniref:F-box domain-containing protein n=1 Tax=Exidia glandulosa HHB12029 TaxID=1314781 RepID=A0A165H4N9_EXIGL|nr:hypothetical protein EXIGLDRAFT_719338 [Exidia glandulosa HHB12029]
MASEDNRSPVAHNIPKERLVKEVASIAHMAVVDALRQLNAGEPHSRLPNEVWHEIWQYLPSLKERFGITHVCSSWRGLARTSPRLWCDLDGRNVALHKDDDVGDCKACTRSLSGFACVDSDLGILKAVLPLSKALPLSLDLTLGAYSMFLKDQLSSVLELALQRLESIRLVAESDSAIACALTLFGKLPRLRRLFISNTELGFTDRLWQDDVDLPALERLEIKSVADRAHTTPRSLPALTTLRFPFVALRQIIGYLKTSQRLSSLYLSGGLVSPVGAIPSAEHRDEIRRLAGSIPRVSVSHVSRQGEAWVLTLFHVPSRIDFFLHYRRQVSATGLAGFAIFAELGVPVCLSLTQQGKTMTIDAVGSCGRKREIRGTFDAAELVDAVSTALPAGSVHALTINFDLTDALERCQFHWPDVASLTLRLPRVLHVSCDLLHGRPSPRAWSRLSTLTLEPSDKDRITVLASAVDTVVRFAHRSDLNTLVLRRVDGVAGDALAGLANTVSVVRVHREERTGPCKMSEGIRVYTARDVPGPCKMSEGMELISARSAS